MTGAGTTGAMEEERAGNSVALLPQRHQNHDLFICDVLDAIPKDDMASMEHPIFSLSTRPDTRILRYEHKNVVVEIAPSVRGLATIYDKDILIYCVSQLMAKKNAGQPLAQTLHLNAHDLLVWTNRETSGDGYRRWKDAFERLRGTTITTNIRTNGEDEVQGFGLIESFRIIRETVTEVSACRSVALGKDQMPDDAKTGVTVSPNETVCLRPTVEADTKAVFRQNAKHFRKGGLQPCTVVVIHHLSSVTRLVTGNIRRVGKDEIHTFGWELGQDGEAVGVKNHIALSCHGRSPFFGLLKGLYVFRHEALPPGEGGGCKGKGQRCCSQFWGDRERRSMRWFPLAEICGGAKSPKAAPLPREGRSSLANAT